MNTSVECMYCIIKRADSMFCQYIDAKEERLNFI